MSLKYPGFLYWTITLEVGKGDKKPQQLQEISRIRVTHTETHLKELGQAVGHGEGAQGLRLTLGLSP